MVQGPQKKADDAVMEGRLDALARLFRDTRLGQGLTQQQVADKAGVSQHFISVTLEGHPSDKLTLVPTFKVAQALRIPSRKVLETLGLWVREQ
jgi:transcriptional regulator with XRE-family HTH domain